MKLKECYICGSKTKIYKVVNGYTLLKCLDCDLVFTLETDFKNRSEINKKMYSYEYLNNYEARKSYLLKRFIKRVNEIESIKKGGRILDFGCSNGLFLEIFHNSKKFKWDMYGIDVNYDSIKFAKSRKMKIKFLCTTLKKARFKSSFFDVITCFDVLEHDINLKTDIKELYKLLKPNGLLVVQCPNYKSYMTLICKDNWDWWSLPDHVFHFSHKNLIELLNNANFYILKERSWDPMNEFVRNIQGTIRINIKNILGKFISKFSYYFLILLWIISVKFKQFFKMGALTLIFAMKK